MTEPRHFGLPIKPPEPEPRVNFAMLACIIAGPLALVAVIAAVFWRMG